MLAVSNYDEFLKVVEVIAESYSVAAETLSEEPSVVVLVGPSGSGKSKIATRFLDRTEGFEKLVSYTTKDPTAVEENQWYNYVSLDTFRHMCESGEMMQSTMYAGHGYGSRKGDVESILAQGKHLRCHVFEDPFQKCHHHLYQAGQKEADGLHSEEEFLY